MSPSVMNVPIAFTNNSGADVAAAINVAPATSLDIESAETRQTLVYYFFSMRKLCPRRADDPRRERLACKLLLASFFSLAVPVICFTQFSVPAD